MRTIRFRGWDESRKEWVYGYYFTFGDRAFVIEPGKPGIPEQTIEVVPESVGQFTGLCDRNGNGKEIYEGDIGVIRVIDIGRVLCKCVQVDGGWAWEKLDLMQAIRANPSPFWSLLVKDFEVIGNIYEMP